MHVFYHNKDLKELYWIVVIETIFFTCIHNNLDSLTRSSPGFSSAYPKLLETAESVNTIQYTSDILNKLKWFTVCLIMYIIYNFRFSYTVDSQV